MRDLDGLRWPLLATWNCYNRLSLRIINQYVTKAICPILRWIRFHERNYCRVIIHSCCCIGQRMWTTRSFIVRRKLGRQLRGINNFWIESLSLIVVPYNDPKKKCQREEKGTWEKIPGVIFWRTIHGVTDLIAKMIKVAKINYSMKTRSVQGS